MNQVSFYVWFAELSVPLMPGLNPFMNQVSFYVSTPDSVIKCPHYRLNPFMNQVSFYQRTPKLQE